MSANDPFSEAAIQARIGAEVSRTLAKWEARDKEIFPPETDDATVNTITTLLDIHARTYLTVLNHEIGQSGYATLLQRVKSGLISDAAQWDVFEGPYNEQSIRVIARESGDLPARAHTLSPQDLEREICFHIDRIKDLHKGDAEKWIEWRDQLLRRMGNELEQRVKYWTARASEQLSQIPKGSSSAYDSQIAQRVELAEKADHRAAVDAYINEVLRLTGKRIARTAIWKAAGYKTRTEFERWERGDRRATKTANERFTDILSRKPHLK